MAQRHRSEQPGSRISAAREYNVDPAQGGAFGLDTVARGPFNYAVIDDVTNSLAVSKVRDSF
jgi:hypothetical protein